MLPSHVNQFKIRLHESHVNTIVFRGTGGGVVDRIGTYHRVVSWVLVSMGWLRALIDGADRIQIRAWAGKGSGRHRPGEAGGGENGGERVRLERVEKGG